MARKRYVRMMAPLLPHGSALNPTAPDGTLPEVRLDVRIGSGRASSYDFSRGEFLLGGGEGCDLRLPGSHMPAVICQFQHVAEGVRLRRLAPAFPILLNGAPLPGPAPVFVKAGDRVAVGSADIVVNIHGQGHLRPTFHKAKTARQPVVQAPATSEHQDALQQERAALDDYRKKLSDQAHELEADRVAWYLRRQQIESEVRSIQESATAGTKLADREAWLQSREAEVATRERELATVREELAEIRQTLFQQYRERRDQVEQMQQVVQGATSTFQERQSRTEVELEAKREQLEADRQKLQEYIQAAVQQRSEELEAAFRRQRMELEVQYETRLRDYEHQAANRRDQFADELRAFEPKRAEFEDQRAQLTSAYRELDTQRQQLLAMRDELARERVAMDAERKWHDEQRAEREHLHTARETEQNRQEEQLEESRLALEEERRKHADDLLRLDRWQAAVEDRQLQLDRRAADIDQRVAQLTRDAIELEEQTKLADAEQQRQAEEAERLEKLKLELNARTSQLSDRSAQLEAQQATLAILRSRLDRQEDDLHREAVAHTADRARLDASQRELDERLKEAEHLRATLGSYQTTNSQAELSLNEQHRLLEATLREIRQQKEQLQAEEERLRRKEQDLDLRSSDIAEQTAVMKAKTTLAIELQQRLEADREAIRLRESTLSDVDVARGTFQEQLRKRSEELSAREKELNAALSQIADGRLALDRLRVELAQERERNEQTLSTSAQQLAERETELTRQSQLLAEREAALERQVQRLRETGQSVAAGRKDLHNAKQLWQAEQSTLVQQTVQTRQELEAFRARAFAEMDALRKQAPELEGQAKDTLEKLVAAREVLRGQVSELHNYASQTRTTLDTLRDDLRAEAERVRTQEADLDRAKGEHRLAVTEFRTQVLEWQSKLGELRKTMSQSEQRIEQKRAELEAASRNSDETATELVRRLEQLRLDQDDLTERRSQVERHLADMREWYRKKLRDLAAERQDVQLPPAPASRIASHPVVMKLNAGSATEADLEIEPGDRQLGDKLLTLELVDADSLNSLWLEARRQRRTLRQVLLAQGTVTLYQLALIEAGNLDGLMLGRFRVMDRLRVTPKEALYRVIDPQSADAAIRVLRVLGEVEMHDATHPDEYRQRFATLLQSPHPNLAATLDVTEVQGRPAIVQEPISGLPGSEFPATVSTPGVWLALFTQAAAGVNAAHAVGLIHGRLTSDSFVLAPSGVLKVMGFGEPPWLGSGASADFEPTPAADLRTLGQVAFLWSQASGKKRLRGSKGFPEPLQAIIRRLDTDALNPMADTMTSGEPYRSAAELLADLEKLATRYPCPSDAWGDLLRQVQDSSGEAPVKKAG